MLSAEARARGESLQEYLLDLLDREAHDIENRRHLAEWTPGSLSDETNQVDLGKLISSERHPR
jgi:hypothetical protein